VSAEQITALADRFGASAALIRRSVEARAAASGSSVDVLLAAWSGGTPPPTPPAPPTPVEEAVAPSAAAPAVQREEPVQPAAAPEPIEETLVPAAPRPIAQPVGFSAWMISAFLIIPLFGLLYLVVNSNGVACGDGGTLEVAFDGSLVNCDGTPFEGRGGGAAEAAAFLTIGQDMYNSVAQCSSCHGANGQGGAGPAFTGGAVVATFPSCEDQIAWITLGSNGWSVDVGSTYGADAKPVQGGMPAFGADLSDEQIRAVAAFERIRFGGAPAEETMIQCGLIEAEPALDDPSAEG